MDHSNYSRNYKLRSSQQKYSKLVKRNEICDKINTMSINVDMNQDLSSQKKLDKTLTPNSKLEVKDDNSSSSTFYRKETQNHYNTYNNF